MTYRERGPNGGGGEASGDDSHERFKKGRKRRGRGMVAWREREVRCDLLNRLY